MNVPLRRPAAAVGVLLTAAATWLLAHEGHAVLPTKGARVDAATGQVVLSRDAREALGVQTAEVEARPVAEGVLAYAAVVTPWRQHAFASSLLGGRVAKLLARPGQVVAAGQVLAEVESVELETLQLDVLTARNDIRAAERVLEGLRAARGSVSEQSVLEAENTLAQARNALAVTRSRWLALGMPGADLDALLRDGRQRPGRTLPVLTPVAGTVTHADLAVGKMIGPLEHLFEIVDLSRVWVRIDLLERDVHRVAVGHPVEVRLTAYPGEAFAARVAVLGAALDPRTHLAAAWAELPNPPGQEPRLVPGMSGEARVLVPGPAGVTVPTGAVTRDGAEHYVLVEEAGATGASEYRRRPVAVGREAGGRVEVLAGGLYPGDRVVTLGGHELASLFVQGVLRLSPEAARTIGLVVEPVAARAVDDVFEIDGLVDLPPDRRASASSPLAGAVSRLLVDRGQTVRAGDVLAEVVSLDLQALQLDYLRAHLEGRMLEDTLVRTAPAARTGAAPRRELIDLEARVNASRHQRDALRAKLRFAGLTADQLDAALKTGRVVEVVPVRSPIDGAVVSFDRTLGQSVRAEEPVLTVHDPSRPAVQGFLGERDLARTRVGQAVRVRLIGDPGFVADGTVARSGRVVGADSRSLSVWVDLDRPPARPLLHNQLARLAVVVSRSAPTLAVPLSAVVREGTRAFAFVRQPDGTFDRRAVRLGRADDRHAEVLDGLRPGDPVAVRGAADLQTAYAGIR